MISHYNKKSSIQLVFILFHIFSINQIMTN